MLQFDRFTLDNGLRVIVHHDENTPMVAVNLLYDVGARDEDEERTGFAHLFEHLMFGGSENIPVYDDPLQMAGGENNAYTSNDVTNYYLQLPLQNIETAFWLESDRMNKLAFSEKSLDVQRKVVSEEFKEHYINKPYGSAWEQLRALAYKEHPYKWMTIGKELKHIEEAQLQDVKDFFYKHYRPNNAVLCVAGNVTTEQVKELAEKWFGPIPKGDVPKRNLPQEPKQTEARELTFEADVPLNAIWMAWHVGDRLSPTYQAVDLITEVMGNGQSSRLYQSLVKEQQIFSSISCYHTGSHDPGLLVIEGKLIEGKTFEEAKAAIDAEIDELLQNGVTEEELQKTKNRIESMISFEDMGLLSRANNLAFYELLGDANMINEEWDKYNSVTREYLLEVAKEVFRKENNNTLYYKKKETK